MNHIKILFKITALLLLISVFSCKDENENKIIIIETTDLHGVILPYDFIEKKDLKVSLANISTYIKKTKKENSAVILLDNGDNLQGQPLVYYYNFIDTVSTHINAEVMNYLGYSASSVGNHDIEAGHPVYDRLIKQYGFPLLAANAVNKITGKPYFKPYTIINEKGFRILVFGMITPEVPTWLPPELYSGIEFREMVETAKKWMPELRKENADLIVGLFHSGWDEGYGENLPGESHHDENGSAAVAKEVPGFDIILTGHDHKVLNKKIINSAGDSVLILDGGSRAEKIARADIVFTQGKTAGKIKKHISGQIIDVDNYPVDGEFIAKFGNQKKIINEFVGKKIATFRSEVSSRDAFFGPSAFVDMIHKIQLDITHADISFAAPLSFDVRIAAGPVTVGDMFKLYRFENMLYTMELSGSEIRKYLEFSYSGWLSTMKGPGDHLIKIRVDNAGNPVLKNGFAWLVNQPYNFDSAAGIDYIVDVSKPEGERVRIKSLSDGTPFDPMKIYKVAVNSYRGNGGGGHLTNGAGIAANEIPKRLIASTDKDLRYYILKYLESEKVVNPAASDNWKIIPENWASRAGKKDYRLLFGK